MYFDINERLNKFNIKHYFLSVASLNVATLLSVQVATLNILIKIVVSLCNDLSPAFANNFQLQFQNGK